MNSNSSGFFTSNNTFGNSSDNLSTAHNQHIPDLHSHTASSPMHDSQPAIDTTSSDSTGGDLNETNISSMLNNFSLGLNASQQELPTTTYSLKISRLPRDISAREPYALFALAEGILCVELHPKDEERTNVGNTDILDTETFIIAKFESLPLAVRYANTLNEKLELFGPSFPFKSHIELIDESNRKHIPFQTMLAPGSYDRPNSQQQTLPGNSLGSNARPQLSGQRSRFSFSDPFSLEAGQPLEQGTHQIKSSSMSHAQTTDLGLKTRDLGKSLLLMENDEINDNIWGPSGINTFSNTPQPPTPTMPWSSGPPSTTGRRQSSVFFLPSAGGSTIQPPLSNLDMQQSMQMNNMPNTISGSTSSMNAYGLMNQMPPQNQNLSQQMNPMLGAVNEMNGGAGQGFNSQSHLSNIQNVTPHKNKLPASGNRPIPSHGASTPPNNVSHGPIDLTSMGSGMKPATNPSVAPANVAGSSTMSQADLSLLAKVPPPANPADQNPPCNTLYVGNLPPDATEQELRHLFSAQQGFRRLSFRNKNGNGNGHGPMCFVEFDDVSFATRALAELYGSKLPRSTISNKGGIRLSFSKNPLGVRGPNSKRNLNTPTNTGTSPNNSIQHQGPPAGNALNNVNYSYTLGYTKST
ncbi:mRNA-binding protein WHI3 KNAG_0F01120 [Huiozyma naganishii CBS 8797]|uniref:RRM domain-containing protein n=1 Tax=Huiozyma naganishii (strain ATCC MYA-139 / BCRC 22969 / CBS 8797 / KCTC 17520 / NBRC 10181 / NCYC 3082 / Yp74L-3) TaxID=1071383 RepID=J7R7D7_HUIN7|nr:hypothetical protein KNAG_0F01120 [Kazachstania naganishii CBS 8797]CCK70780.1 hypothetical protein KNAG_0F01120 [Kazachstania naganishii CBS 8797]